MSDKLDLDALEALERTATPGPWRADGHEIVQLVGLPHLPEAPMDYYPGSLTVAEAYDSQGCFEGQCENGIVRKEDAALIAAARNALPALVARVRELEARLSVPCAGCPDARDRYEASKAKLKEETMSDQCKNKAEWWLTEGAGPDQNTVSCTAHLSQMVSDSTTDIASYTPEDEEPCCYVDDSEDRLESTTKEQREANYIDIVFDGPPSHESGRFVEVEDPTGASIRVGEWIEGGSFWRLRMPDPRRIADLEAQIEAKGEDVKNLQAELKAAGAEFAQAAVDEELRFQTVRRFVEEWFHGRYQV